jgi:peroxiredoxin
MMSTLVKNLLAGAVAALALGTSALLTAAEVGKPAPAFTLTDTNGKSHSLSDFKGKVVILEWINPGCPFVKRHYKQKNMQNLQEAAAGKGVIWLSINSTVAGHKNHLTNEAANKINTEWGGNATALLMDGDGKVGKAYDAKTTPQLYIINKDGTLVYNGGIDGKPSSNADEPVEPSYITAALEEVLAGKEVSNATTKPYGCSVKYTPDA